MTRTVMMQMRNTAPPIMVLGTKMRKWESAHPVILGAMMNWHIVLIALGATRNWELVVTATGTTMSSLCHATVRNNVPTNPVLR